MIVPLRSRRHVIIVFFVKKIKIKDEMMPLLFFLQQNKQREEVLLSSSQPKKKRRRQQLSQPHFETSVRMRLTLPKVGTWSPPRLMQLQSSIAKVKTPHLEMFFIPLERP